MGYRIEIDQAGCINCGICMDTCPVAALDMTRPTRGGVETGGRGPAQPWMMEHPIQVGECVGCSICVRECPVAVISLLTETAMTRLADRQGPIDRPGRSVDEGLWIPLADVTRESLKPTHPSPWGDLLSWRTAERPHAWQAWRSMVGGERESPIAPCQEACPAGTDAGRYVGLIGEGRYDDAFAVAAEVNPFPSACGWICTAPCEAACRRGVLDEPIAIRTLKRFAAEHGSLPPIPPPALRRPDRIAIVGGGPAGMSAAFYLARLGYPVTVFEAMPVPGGMMAIGIPEYRLPRDVLRADIDRILALGVDLRVDQAMGRDFTLDTLEADGYRAIFLATGASKSRPLGVPGDALAGVVPATLFLKQVNLGEEPQLVGDVVVVGGGSTAMDAARSALRSGAVSVTIAYRRGRGDMPAQPEEIEAAEREGIGIIAGMVPVEVVEADGLVTGLRCLESRPSGVTTGGRDEWEALPGTERLLPATTILVAVGEEPDPSILPVGAGIEIGGRAAIVADPRTLATGRPGVFAGGDVVSGPKTIIEAVAAGRRAAGSMHEWLSGTTNGEAQILAAVRYRTASPTSLTLDLEPRARERPPLPVVDVRSFVADQTGFDHPAAALEASRCFRCDAIYGCGTVEVAAGRRPRDPVAEHATPSPMLGGSL